ncbi:hypothetical protein B0H11DRAFT_1914298 [Mycena galericulata]|nr:hypothetical protein B0H11DRAFT_1914298 [Mycena galericulata]
MLRQHGRKYKEDNRVTHLASTRRTRTGDYVGRDPSGEGMPGYWVARKWVIAAASTFRECMHSAIPGLSKLTLCNSTSCAEGGESRQLIYGIAKSARLETPRAPALQPPGPRTAGTGDGERERARRRAESDPRTPLAHTRVAGKLCAPPGKGSPLRTTHCLLGAKNNGGRRRRGQRTKKSEYSARGSLWTTTKKRIRVGRKIQRRGRTGMRIGPCTTGEDEGPYNQYEDVIDCAGDGGERDEKEGRRAPMNAITPTPAAAMSTTTDAGGREQWSRRRAHVQEASRARTCQRSEWPGFGAR